MVVVANSVTGSRLDGSGRLGVPEKTGLVAVSAGVSYSKWWLIGNWGYWLVERSSANWSLVGSWRIVRLVGVCRARETGSGECEFSEDGGCVGWG